MYTFVTGRPGVSKVEETIRLMPRGVKNEILNPVDTIDPTIAEWLTDHGCLTPSGRTASGLKWTAMGCKVRERLGKRGWC